MKWEKLGLIFPANEYNYFYAKSPQAIIFDNYIRVYFSTCKQDGKKLISYVSYVDFDEEFNSIQKVATQCVLSEGELGCYDEHGVFPFSPVRYRDRLLGYISGWTRRVSVSCDSGIGISESFDGGNTFQRLGKGPVLSSSLHEPFLVIDGFVRHYDGIFHMWYIYGLNWQKLYINDAMPERTYRIAHATSLDGISWKKEGQLIIPSQSEFECQALPSVLQIGDFYYMYFCYRNTYDFRQNKDNSYKIAYARSSDLMNWERCNNLYGLECSENDWDSEMMCYPNIFEVNGNVYLLYNGNEFGKYGFGIAKLMEI